LTQTYQDFEIIILDDFSTDYSREIISQFSSHSKISHIVFNSVNSGSPFKQWEKGISLAQGEYIWIAESDDYCLPNFLEILLPSLKNGVGLAYCRSAIALENGDVNNEYFWPDGLDNFKWRKDYFKNGTSELKESLIYRNTIPNASSCLFRKDLTPNFERVNTMSFCGDWLFWVKILEKSSIYYCSEQLNYFRSHSNSTRQIKSIEKELCRLKEYIEVIEEIKKTSLINAEFKINFSKYSWIFDEIYNRKHLLSTFQYLFPPLPFRMLLEYYKYQLNNRRI